VIVINDRADGGTLNIHDLYVEGTEVATKTEDHFVSVVKKRNIIKIVNSGNALVFHAGNLPSLNPKETFYILNLLGKVVKTGEVSNTIDISGLERGAYLLKVCNFNSMFIKRK
ncbi:MAG TPA: T9SS type A sorting domain-containing protein, partial [Chitinispirillaceae bacterium]|nr:T9SS type A sorting domain-containing protein [Chitinispirillaceae bacterium]